MRELSFSQIIFAELRFAFRRKTISQQSIDLLFQKWIPLAKEFHDSNPWAKYAGIISKLILKLNLAYSGMCCYLCWHSHRRVQRCLHASTSHPLSNPVSSLVVVLLDAFYNCFERIHANIINVSVVKSEPLFRTYSYYKPTVLWQTLTYSLLLS